LAEDFNLRLLTPIEEKKKLFKKIGIDYLFIINFSKEFSEYSYKQFFDDILIDKIKTKHLVLGYDHKFGKNRDGDINKLIEYTKDNSIGMTVVEPKEIDNKIVSSTKIRNEIINGNMESANKMLGRNYCLEGIVVEGAKRGRSIGFPTANIDIKEKNKLLPCNGVYFVKANFNNASYFGVANIGLRPTFNNVKNPITEVHILDFNENIYGVEIEVEFIERLRDEKKFSTKEELEENIKLDIIKVRGYISELNK
jgi:riboflavin kinase/FMN adenylyltransferase